MLNPQIFLCNSSQTFSTLLSFTFLLIALTGEICERPSAMISEFPIATQIFSRKSLHNPAKFRTATSGNPAIEFLPFQSPTTVWPGKTNYWARFQGKKCYFSLHHKAKGAQCVMLHSWKRSRHTDFLYLGSTEGISKGPLQRWEPPGQLSQTLGFNSFVLYRNETVLQIMAHLYDIEWYSSTELQFLLYFSTG